MSSDPSWKGHGTETRKGVRFRVEKKNCALIPWLFFHLAPGMMQSVCHNYPRSTWELSEHFFFLCVRDTKYCWCFPTISFSLSLQKQHGFERAMIGEIIHMKRGFPEYEFSNFSPLDTSIIIPNDCPNVSTLICTILKEYLLYLLWSLSQHTP